MEHNIKQEEFISNKTQLSDIFFQGIKSESDFKVGIEFEKLGINLHNFEAISYSGSNSILEFLKKYKKNHNFEYIHENNEILGLKNNSRVITLEPGGQTEISLFPQESIHDLAKELREYNTITSNLACEEFDICWIGYGVQPVSTYENIQQIPKSRYEIMSNYLPEKGHLALVMMRETAGIQVSLDYKSEEDAMVKLKIALGISPIVTAMFANSPIRNKKTTGYKSFRALSWLNTDEARCGLISPRIFDKDFSFDDYIDIMLDTPMIFLNKKDKWIDMNGKTFRNYLKDGYENHQATISDWLLHMSSFFGDVRLKNYIEIRNCDSQRSNLIPAIPAFWKGILYNNDAIELVEDILKKLSWEELLELRSLVPKHGLQTTLDKIKVIDIAKELVNIADHSLKSIQKLNEDNQDESIYLENLKKLLANNQSPADKILDLWQGEWNSDINKLIEHTRI